MIMLIQSDIYNTYIIIYFDETSILTGSFNEALYNLLTLFVIVAEKRKVFLVLGIISNIALISLSKSIFNNLSASSNTKYFKLFKWNPFVFSKWYNIFPGVPMITCGFYAKALAYVIGSLLLIKTNYNPPNITTDLRAIFEPIASKCSWIYTHNSLVGDKTKAKKGDGCSNRFCNIGRANAKVLPDPVSARAIISFYIHKKN